LKTVGLKARTESPARPALAGKSLDIKTVIGVFLEMMLKVLLNHIFCKLARCDTEIPPRPEMFTPVPFLQVWEFLKDLSRRPSLHPSHDVRRGNIWWRRNENMHMILAGHTAHYLNFETFAGLSHELPNSKGNITLQNVIAVFGYPNKMIFNLIASVASMTVFHAKYYKPTASKMLPA